VERLRALIKAGTRVPGSEGVNAGRGCALSHELLLVKAAAAGHMDTVECLLSLGADPSITAVDGISAAMVAAAQGESGVPVLRRLLAAGADPCAQWRDRYDGHEWHSHLSVVGDTALHCAARALCPAAVTALLAAGARAGATNDKHETPAQCVSHGAVVGMGVGGGRGGGAGMCPDARSLRPCASRHCRASGCFISPCCRPRGRVPGRFVSQCCRTPGHVVGPCWSAGSCLSHIQRVPTIHVPFPCASYPESFTTAVPTIQLPRPPPTPDPPQARTAALLASRREGGSAAMDRFAHVAFPLWAAVGWERRRAAVVVCWLD
jgi:hypothetical protein